MVVGLDIGTSYIRVAIGDYDENGKFRILGTSCEKSMGLGTETSLILKLHQMQ